MSGYQGTISRRKQKNKKKPTGLFCKGCLEQVILLPTLSTGFECENCVRKYVRNQVLTFDEMISVKFARVKYRNLNQLKRDMRP